MYFVIEATTVNGETAKAITHKSTLREATMLYYQVMASIIANDNVENGFCTILDSNGKQMFDYIGHYVRPAN